MAEWNAGDYSRNSSAQYGWARELIDRLALRDNESVLDIGCGDGKVTALIARTCIRGTVVGIDSSPDMIREAAASFGAAGYPNLRFLEMSADRIKLPDRFDVAFSNAVFHWVEDFRSAVLGTASVLNDGGRVLFQMGGRGNAAVVKAAVDEVCSRAEYASFFSDFRFRYFFRDVTEAEVAFRGSGLRLTRSELIDRDMVHRGRDGFAGWWRTTWFPYADAVPARLRQAFTDDVIDRYLEINPPDASGNVHTPMVRLELEAEKT